MPDRANIKHKAIAIVVSVAVHAAVLIALLFLYLRASKSEEQGGILVNIGDTELASGMFVPHQLEPDYQPVPPLPEPVPTTPQESNEEPLLTQEQADAPIVKPKKEQKEQQQKLERQKAREAEQRQRKEQQEAEHQRRAKEEAEKQRRERIQKSVSGAFGATGKKGSGTDPNAEPETKGSPDGNVSSGGASSGVGGFGSFSLQGRKLGSGGLQRPSYSVQEEGDIVISITVNPQGEVTHAFIGAGTTIGNQTLRNSAISAAKATRFNAIDGNNNQTGTITYRFRLK